jgi:hypothetical protein
MNKGRRRDRQPWWKFGPPHAERYWARAIESEKPTLRLIAVAAILRTTPSAIRRAAASPAFPMPPAICRPLTWTEGQVERLLWAPQDHQENLQQTGTHRNRPRT